MFIVVLLLAVTASSLMAKDGLFVSVFNANEFFETRTVVEEEFTEVNNVAERLSNGASVVMRKGILTLQLAAQYSDNKIEDTYKKMIEVYANGGLTLPLGSIFSLDLTMGTNYYLNECECFYYFSNVKAGADIYIGNVDLSCFAMMLSPFDSGEDLFTYYQDKENQLLKFGVGIGLQVF